MLLRKNSKDRFWSVGLSTIFIGILVGMGANILGETLSFVEQLFLNFKESTVTPVSTNISSWQRFFSVLFGSIVSSFIWFFLHKKFELTSVDQALKGKKMSVIGTIIHDFVQTFYIGTGGSVGRESAPRELGAMIAQKWAQLANKLFNFTLSRDDTRLLIASAAGAGLAGQYIAPLAGTFFTLEILYKHINKKSIVISLSMSIIATLIGIIKNGYKPYYNLGEKKISLNLVFFAIIISPILGILGFLFKSFVSKAKNNKIKTPKILYSLPLAGLLTGVTACFYPYVTGNGRGIAQFSYNITGFSKSVTITLIIYILLKSIITIYTIYSGAYGGILTPSISIGAALGVLAGFVYVHFFSGVSLFECGLVGSVAFLSASQEAPLMAMFLVFELCHLEPSSFIPMGMAAATSIGIYFFLKDNKITDKLIKLMK